MPTLVLALQNGKMQLSDTKASAEAARIIGEGMEVHGKVSCS